MPMILLYLPGGPDPISDHQTLIDTSDFFNFDNLLKFSSVTTSDVIQSAISIMKCKSADQGGIFMTQIMVSLLVTSPLYIDGDQAYI